MAGALLHTAMLGARSPPSNRAWPRGHMADVATWQRAWHELERMRAKKSARALNLWRLEDLVS